MPFFIACGDPHHGFARIYCDACGHDYLLAFSCNYVQVGIMRSYHSASIGWLEGARRSCVGGEAEEFADALRPSSWIADCT